MKGFGENEGKQGESWAVSTYVPLLAPFGPPALPPRASTCAGTREILGTSGGKSCEYRLGECGRRTGRDMGGRETLDNAMGNKVQREGREKGGRERERERERQRETDRERGRECLSQ